MPVVITPSDTTPPDELRLRALNIRTANGRDRDTGGNLVPAGTIFTAAVLGVYRAGEWMYDLDPVTVPDAAAWVAGLFGAGDKLAAAAAEKFGQADDCLKWLTALRASQDGVCDRPAA